MVHIYLSYSCIALPLYVLYLYYVAFRMTRVQTQIFMLLSESIHVISWQMTVYWPQVNIIFWLIPMLKWRENLTCRKNTLNIKFHVYNFLFKNSNSMKFSLKRPRFLPYVLARLECRKLIYITYYSLTRLNFRMNFFNFMLCRVPIVCRSVPRQKNPDPVVFVLYVM